jgi:hypothetical protein
MGSRTDHPGGVKEEPAVLLDERLAACRREQNGSHGSSKISKHIVQNTGKDAGMDQRSQVSRKSEADGRVV